MAIPAFPHPSRYVRTLHVAEDCLTLPYTQEIIERVGLQPHIIPVGEMPKLAGSFPENLSEGKHHLLLSKNKGSFFKPCPGTREYRCCGYHVLSTGMNCPMDCVYCILQAYLNNPWMSCFVNIDQMFAELDAHLDSHGDDIFRIGTGEFADSLALDDLTGISTYLVKYMARKKNAVLELKTKSAVIENLQDVEHGGRTVVAWSLNSPVIMAREEIRTASLQERLEAAALCAEWGYKLAFHFDPIIFHPGWEKGYQQTIDQLYSVVPAEAITWISMGALRYLPALKKTAGLRFPGSHIFYEEFIDGLDGKQRYFRTQRVAMYKHILSCLQKYAAEKTCIYFCMENDTIWQEVFGYVPDDRGGIPAMLDSSVQG